MLEIILWSIGVMFVAALLSEVFGSDRRGSGTEYDNWSQ